jgi:hypothetical protein
MGLLDFFRRRRPEQSSFGTDASTGAAVGGAGVAAHVGTHDDADQSDTGASGYDSGGGFEGGGGDGGGGGGGGDGGGGGGGGG